MRGFAFAFLALALAACSDPVTNQAKYDTRHDPVRADSMISVEFPHGAAQLDAARSDALKTIVTEGRRAQRDEFLVVTDGSGGPAQQIRANNIRQTLEKAGARWVRSAVQPAMPMGPNSVVIVRSEYRIGMWNCPDHSNAAQWNPNESVSPGFGCADAYNQGQMLARPRDAAVGRDAGPADGTVNADAVQRYRAGRVRPLMIQSTTGSSSSGAAPSGDTPSPSTTN
jgi:type IV pilus biogenesis protein CpaD/CtpE